MFNIKTFSHAWHSRRRTVSDRMCDNFCAYHWLLNAWKPIMLIMTLDNI